MKKILIFITALFLTVLLTSQNLYAATPQIGSTYYSYLQATPVNDFFGKAERIGNGGVASTKTVRTYEGWLAWDYTTIELKDKLYVIYKFDKPLNTRVKKMDRSYIYLTAGSTYKSSYTIYAGTTYSYQNSMTSELKIRQGVSSELSVDGLDYFGGKISTYSEVETGVSQTVQEEKTVSYSTTQTFEHTINVSESGYFSYEERGSFRVYVIQVFEAQYEKISEKKQNWLGYTSWIHNYNLKTHKLIEQSVYYEFIEGSVASGFFAYKLKSDGTFSYNDYRQDGIAYL